MDISICIKEHGGDHSTKSAILLHDVRDYPKELALLHGGRNHRQSLDEINKSMDFN